MVKTLPCHKCGQTGYHLGDCPEDTPRAELAPPGYGCACPACMERRGNERSRSDAFEALDHIEEYLSDRFHSEELGKKVLALRAYITGMER